MLGSSNYVFQCVPTFDKIHMNLSFYGNQIGEILEILLLKRSFSIPNGTKWNVIWKIVSITTGFYTKCWFKMKSSQFIRNLLISS